MPQRVTSAPGVVTTVTRVRAHLTSVSTLGNQRPAVPAGPPGRPTQTDGRGPRDLRVCGAAVVLRALEGQAAEATLDIEAGLVRGAVVDAGHALVDVCKRPRGRMVKAEATRADPAHRPDPAHRGGAQPPASQGRRGQRPSLPSVAAPWSHPLCHCFVCRTFTLTECFIVHSPCNECDNDNEPL